MVAGVDGVVGVVVFGMEVGVVVAGMHGVVVGAVVGVVVVVAVGVAPVSVVVGAVGHRLDRRHCRWRGRWWRRRRVVWRCRRYCGGRPRGGFFAGCLSAWRTWAWRLTLHC
jgi:hypothetical protein